MFIISKKISKDKWLNTKVKYSDNIINDCSKYIFKKIIQWIHNQTEIIYIGDFITDYNNFTDFIYNYYLHPIQKLQQNEDELFEYFDLKYSDSIHNLYTELRDYSQGNNLTIFDNSTYDLLIDYIYSIIEINDIYIDDYEYETGNEINDEYEDYKFISIQ